VKRRILSSFAALAVAALPVSQAWSACYSPAETQAVQVRMLQSELMVAALACRDSNPELAMITKYNAFVNRHSTGLVSQTRVLERHFDRHFGPQGKRRMDTLLTAIANDASKRSMTSDFCGSASSLFGAISVMEWPQLLRLAGDRANGQVAEMCAATNGVREGRAVR
jgi:hypothetical protein